MMPRSTLATLLALPFALLTSDAHANAPAHFWSQGHGGASFDESTAVAVDAAGNVFITGAFYGTVDFGRDVLVSTGTSDVFIAKYSASGNAQWAKKFGDIDGDSGFGIAVTAGGDIVVTGTFSGTVDFGGGPLVAGNQIDIFLARFNTDGTHLWSRQFGSFGPEYANAVAVDAGGNIILHGEFKNSVDFGGGVLNSAGDYDIFLAKYDGDGTHLWSKRFGDTGSDGGSGVDTDASRNVFITGSFEGTVNFGGGNLVNPGGGADLFLAKYDQNGTHAWSQAFGGASSQIGRALTTDGAGNVIMAGRYQGNVDFGGGPLLAQGIDIILAKYAPNGAHMWSKRFGSTGTDDALGVATDVANNVFFTGFFTGTVDFGGGGLTSAGGVAPDMFLARYDANGTHAWSQNYGGTGVELGRALALDAAGNPVVTGYFEGPTDFGGGLITPVAGYDIYLAKYGREPAAAVIASISDIGNDQGGKVKVRFDRSGHDQPASPTPISWYEVYRRDDAPPASATATREPVAPLHERRPFIDGWTYLGSVPSHGEASYGIDVPTIGDSTVAHGQYYSVFFVRGSTASPFTFFDAPADSGYSLDNLAPGAPQNLVYAGGQLFWSQPPTADFDYFTVYGAAVNDFAAAVVIGHTVLAALDVAASPHSFYFVTATDFSGNEGTPASFSTATGVEGTPSSYVLAVSNFPNPFNPGTTVGYTVPSRGPVTITIHDSRGALVATLVDGAARDAGTYRVEWDGRASNGTAVASGVYFARIEHAGAARSRKMVVLK